MMNLKEEIRIGFKISVEQKKIWQVQLDLLTKVLTICEKYKLRIWAEAGTLLGTIRHRGFIPWDDDIDLAMMRPDYERLLEVARGEISYPYYLQSAYNEPGYFRGHAQLRNSETTAILPIDLWQDFNQGIFIDIFVYDAMPSDTKNLQEKFDIVEELRQKMYIRNYGSYISRSVKEIKRFINAVHYFKNKSFLATYKELESVFSKFEFTDKCTVFCPAFTTSIYDRYNKKYDWYEETIWMPFEDIMIPVPKQYDKILTRQYGDYMKPVKSPTMHGEVIFDTERPYTEVLKELRKKASLKEKIRYLLMPPPATN